MQCISCDAPGQTKASAGQQASWGTLRPSRMRRKTWLGVCRVMQLMDSIIGVAAGSIACLALPRTTACTVRVLPAGGSHNVTLSVRINLHEQNHIVPHWDQAKCSMVTTAAADMEGWQAM